MPATAEEVVFSADIIDCLKYTRHCEERSKPCTVGGRLVSYAEIASLMLAMTVEKVWAAFKKYNDE